MLDFIFYLTVGMVVIGAAALCTPFFRERLRQQRHREARRRMRRH